LTSELAPVNIEKPARKPITRPNIFCIILAYLRFGSKRESHDLDFYYVIIIQCNFLLFHNNLVYQTHSF
jgi:hypothetical protein